jgi:hypothetical protein
LAIFGKKSRGILKIFFKKKSRKNFLKMEKIEKPRSIKIVEILQFVRIFFLLIFIFIGIFAVFFPPETGFFAGFCRGFLQKFPLEKNIFAEFCGRICGQIFLSILILLGAKKRGKIFYFAILILCFSGFARKDLIFIATFFALLFPSSRQFFFAKK